MKLVLRILLEASRIWEETGVRPSQAILSVADAKQVASELEAIRSGGNRVEKMIYGLGMIDVIADSMVPADVLYLARPEQGLWECRRSNDDAACAIKYREEQARLAEETLVWPLLKPI